MAARHRQFGYVAALVVLLPGLAGADEWEHRLAPYIWWPGFRAEFTFPTGPSEGETTLGDLLEGAFFLAGEARKDAWSIYGEFNYLKLGEPLDGVPPIIGAELGLEGVMLAGEVGHAIYRTDRSRIEATGGFRYWNVELSSETALPPTSNSGRFAWFDPIVGLHGEYVLTDSILLLGDADIGGFGVGSKLQTNVSVAARWQFAGRWSGTLGYRDQRVEFEENGFLADMELYGPYVELGVSF